jgi:hypothetical protein
VEKSIAMLLEKAAPVIKYRTLKELCDHTTENVLEEAYQEVLTFSETQKRILQLKQQNISNIHGAKSDCFENSLAMAIDYGLTAQSHSYDSIFDIRNIIEYYESLVSENIKNNHFRVTMYPFFLRAGYSEKELIDFMINRIETIYLFIKNKDYNIYDDASKHKSMPKNYRDRPIIKQELYQNYNFNLPLIYDIIGFKELYHIGNESIRSKICSIIEYIATEEYHDFVPFYGIVKIPTGYIAMGWDCMLPYFGGNAPTSNSLFLQRMELFSNFPPIINTNWFQKGIETLNYYKTENDTYLLPEEFLIEQDKCWLLGNHMKLGEKKKSESSRELESTFWVTKIKRNAELCK